MKHFINPDVFVALTHVELCSLLQPWFWARNMCASTGQEAPDKCACHMLVQIQMLLFFMEMLGYLYQVFLDKHHSLIIENKDSPHFPTCSPLHGSFKSM